MTDQRPGSAPLTKCPQEQLQIRSDRQWTPIPSPRPSTPSLVEGQVQERRARLAEAAAAGARREPGHGQGRGLHGEGAGAAAVLQEGVARGPVAIFWAPRQSPTRVRAGQQGGPSGLRGGQRPRQGWVAAAGWPGGARGQEAAAVAAGSYRKIGGSG